MRIPIYGTNCPHYVSRDKTPLPARYHLPPTVSLALTTSHHQPSFNTGANNRDGITPQFEMISKGYQVGGIRFFTGCMDWVLLVGPFIADYVIYYMLAAHLHVDFCCLHIRSSLHF